MSVNFCVRLRSGVVITDIPPSMPLSSMPKKSHPRRQLRCCARPPSRNVGRRRGPMHLIQELPEAIRSVEQFPARRSLLRRSSGRSRKFRDFPAFAGPATLRAYGNTLLRRPLRNPAPVCEGRAGDLVYLAPPFNSAQNYNGFFPQIPRIGDRQIGPSQGSGRDSARILNEVWALRQWRAS